MQIVRNYILLFDEIYFVFIIKKYYQTYDNWKLLLLNSLYVEIILITEAHTQL